MRNTLWPAPHRTWKHLASMVGQGPGTLTACDTQGATSHIIVLANARINAWYKYSLNLSGTGAVAAYEYQGTRHRLIVQGSAAHRHIQPMEISSLFQSVWAGRMDTISRLKNRDSRRDAPPH